MIPRGYITEWNETVPWINMHQVEQDLIISRALVAIYNDEYLSKRLAFRGGTALHRLYMAPQVRYSEDIDLVQIIAEPIGQTLTRLREVLSFLGKPATLRKESNNTMVHKMQSTFPPETTMKLKVEINCKEHFSILGYREMPYRIVSTWFSGNCTLITFDINELIGTKLRALYQRRKGRDLFDLYFTASSPLFDPVLAIDCFRRYIEFSDKKTPSPKEFLYNLEEKMKIPQFLKDMDGLIHPGFAYDPYTAFDTVKEVFIQNL